MIIFTWAVPITISILFLIHYKFQYWLPVALPLFSSVVILLPEKLQVREIPARLNFKKWIPWLILSILSIQFLFNVVQDVNLYTEHLNREQNEPAIQFYDRAEKILSPLPSVRVYHVYHDVRMYVPARSDWYCESIFEILDYSYLQEKTFDVLLLRQQRIYDYLSPNAVGINIEKMNASQAFYRDADQSKINGYQLLFRDEYGLIFVRNRLYQNYFNK